MSQDAPHPRAADAISRYQAFLAKLPPENKESILAARDEVLQYVAGEKRCRGDAGCAQGVFEGFRKFYGRVIATCGRAFYQDRRAQDLLSALAPDRLEHPLEKAERSRSAAILETPPDRRPLLHDLFAYRDCGIDFTQGEGDWYLRDDPDWLIAVASHLPGGEYRQYVLFVANQSRERLVEDAGFVVPRDHLRERLVRWDAFIRTHRDVARVQDMRQDADRLAGWYIVGISNSPAFDFETNRLNPELRESFVRFLAANQDCSYYPLIAGLWEKLTASDFRQTEAVVSYLEKQTASSAELLSWVKHLRRPR
jgi:hypothetical protein